jgi:16S rRNA C967 or C1407 C5-methylase (RsmB/RsmF family)
VRLVEEPGALLAGLLRPPPSYVRVNPLRAEVRELHVRLESRGFALADTDLDPNVLRVQLAPISIGATHEHLLGMTTPQDLASASAPIALGAGSAETVVDLAAAPGVKTMHVAGDMEDRGAIVAVEPDAERMRALRFNLERTGVSNTLMLLARGEDVPAMERRGRGEAGAGEAGAGEAGASGAPARDVAESGLRADAGDGPWADRVLLDAPCTGEGTIPRDRARRRGKPDEIMHWCAVQSSLMDAAHELLRPGGTLVYATCTLAPEENEAQVQRLVDRGYRLETLPFSACGGAPLVPGVTEWPGLHLDASMRKAMRFLPGIHPTLGFFVARLRKPVRGGDEA